MAINHNSNTVEPPIVDPPKQGHCIINLSIKDTVRGPKNYMPYSFSTFRTSKRGQPLYKGQNS